MSHSRSEVITATIEANRKLDTYSAARAAGFSIPKARVIAQFGRIGAEAIELADTAGSAMLVESGRGWSIVNDLADVSDLPGGKDWLA